MPKFYSILLDDKTHDELKRLSYEHGKPMSDFIREGIELILNNCSTTVTKKVGNNYIELMHGSGNMRLSRRCFASYR